MLLQALADAGGDADALQMIDSTIVRAHHCAVGAKGGPGPSTGPLTRGLLSKIHLRANAEGLPIAVAPTPGEAHDATTCSALMEDRDSDPGVLLADRGYDSDAIRQDARDRGALPEIPTKRNRRVQHSVGRRLYALRNRVERFINLLKNFVCVSGERP